MDEPTVASKIKQAREQAGLTQAQLAEKVGTTPQNISQYERGIRNPKIETIEKIAKSLNLKVQDFVQADEHLSKAASEFSEAMDLMMAAIREEQHLIYVYRSLNDDGQKKAMGLMEDLANVPYYQRELPSQLAPDAAQTAPDDAASKEPDEK